MNKTAFLKELNKRLRYIPKEDREDAVEYYTELISDMGLDEADDVTAKLGSAKDVAKIILKECTQKHVEDYEEKKSVKGHATVVWLSVLGVLSLPVSLPLAAVVFALAVVIIAVALVLVLSFGAASLSMVVSGLCALGIMFVAPGAATKAAVFGTGLVLLGLGSLLGYGLFALIRFLCRKIFRRDNKAIEAKPVAEVVEETVV